MTESQTLVELVAAVDAIFWPQNGEETQDRDYHALLHVQRSEYLESGLPFVGGGSDAARKRHQRHLEKLVVAGLVDLRTPNRKLRYAKLTEVGEQRARALCGLPCVLDGWKFTRRVVDAKPLKLVAWTGTQREDLLSKAGHYDGTVDQVHELHAMAMAYLPAGSRGWLKTSSDCSGGVHYLATPEGRAAPKPKPLSRLPEADAEAMETYDLLLWSSRCRRRQWLPEEAAAIAAKLAERKEQSLRLGAAL